jgi:hypothetical protein
MGGGEAKLRDPNTFPIQDSQTTVQSDQLHTPTEISCVFAIFPKLPAELRLKIWKEALLGPRFIEICFTDRAPEDKITDRDGQ